jgi:hypothetical protein
MPPLRERRRLLSRPERPGSAASASGFVVAGPRRRLVLDDLRGSGSVAARSDRSRCGRRSGTPPFGRRARPSASSPPGGPPPRRKLSTWSIMPDGSSPAGPRARAHPPASPRRPSLIRRPPATALHEYCCASRRSSAAIPPVASGVISVPGTPAPFASALLTTCTFMTALSGGRRLVVRHHQHADRADQARLVRADEIRLSADPVRGRGHHAVDVRAHGFHLRRPRRCRRPALPCR